MVRTVEHLAARAEVLPQQDAARLLRRRVGREIAPAFVLFQENRRVGEPETVDRLLHVPDHEEFAPIVGEEPKKRVLTGVHVLVFVHEHLGIARRERRGETVGAVLQQSEHHVLLIGKIAKALPPLLGGVGAVELEREREKRVNGGRGLRKLAQQRFGAVGKRVLPFIARLFAVCARGFDALCERVLTLVCADARKFDRAGAPCRLPAEQGGARHVPQPLGGDVKAAGVGFCKRLAPRLRKLSAQRVDARGPVFRLMRRAREQIPSPHGLPGVRALRHGESRALTVEPRGGIGMALHGVVQPEDERGELIVVPPGAERIDERLRAGGRVEPVIELFEQPVEHAGANLPGAVRLDDAVVRRDTGKMGILAQEPAAQAVDRADGGAAAQLRLPPETAVHRVGGDTLAECGENAAAQLAGGGTGIGDDEEIVDVRAAIHVAHEPFDEDLGFPGTGGGRNEPRPAAAFGGELLIRCQRHGGSSSPFSSRAQNSGALSDALKRQPSVFSLKRQAS